MSDDRNPAYVLDMLNAARAIRRFVEGRTQDEFLRDVQLQSAILYKFMVLGEACRGVSMVFREANPTVNWSGIAGFRSKIVHDYDDVNLDEVWKIVESDLPVTIAALDPLVPKEPDGDKG